MAYPNKEWVPDLYDSAVPPRVEHTYNAAYWHGDSMRYPNDEWPVFDSLLAVYEDQFRHVLKSYDGQIVNLLPERPEEPIVVIDVMASTAALAGLRDQVRLRQGSQGPGFQGYAVGLSNTRVPGQDTNQLCFVQGDVRRPVNVQMQGRRADLILERALSGLDVLPLHRAFYVPAFNHLWRLLRPGGAMLLQLPCEIDMVRAGLSLRGAVQNLERQGVPAVLDESDGEVAHLLVKKPV